MEPTGIIPLLISMLPKSAIRPTPKLSFSLNLYEIVGCTEKTFSEMFWMYVEPLQLSGHTSEFPAGFVTLIPA